MIHPKHTTMKQETFKNKPLTEKQKKILKYCIENHKPGDFLSPQKIGEGMGKPYRNASPFTLDTIKALGRKGLLTIKKVSGWRKQHHLPEDISEIKKLLSDEDLEI